MDPTADLTQALAEWRRLTDLEREAILSDNWRGVAEQQARKGQLQPEIQRALARVPTRAAAPPAPTPDAEHSIHSVVGELIAMERRNAGLLVGKRNRRHAESERAARTLLDLQGVRRAYGSSRGPCWQSYS